MFVPQHFRVTDRDALVHFMREHPFATLVSSMRDGLFATHLPLVLERARDRLMLCGHIARANPHVDALAGGDALVIFRGPHAYVSPAAYDSDQNVPTWNYAAVHAYGQTSLVEHDADVERMLARLIDRYEPAYNEQWSRLPVAYRGRLLGGIVGLVITVTRVEGQFKLSQNRSDAERARVAAALEMGDANARAVARMMRTTSVRGAR